MRVKVTLYVSGKSNRQGGVCYGSVLSDDEGGQHLPTLLVFGYL